MNPMEVPSVQDEAGRVNTEIGKYQDAFHNRQGARTMVDAWRSSDDLDAKTMGDNMYNNRMNMARNISDISKTAYDKHLESGYGENYRSGVMDNVRGNPLARRMENNAYDQMKS